MSNMVSWVFELEVKPGEQGGFHDLMHEMVESAREEPGTLNYEWWVNEEGDVCHVYERYKDSDALMQHAGAVGKKFGDRFAATFTPKRLVVYGKPDDRVKEAIGAFGPVFMSSIGGF